MGLENIIKNITYNKEDGIENLTYHMVSQCAFLLLEIDKSITDNKFSASFPLLRQTYEYILISIGLEEKILTINDFLSPYYINKNGNKQYKNLSNIVTKEIINKSQNEKKTVIVASLLIWIKNTLNEHTHASTQRSFRFLLENSNNQDILNFIENDTRIVYDIVQMLLSAFIREKYKLDLEVINIDKFIKRLEKSYQDISCLKEKIIVNLKSLYGIDEIEKYINDLNKKIHADYLEIKNICRKK